MWFNFNDDEETIIDLDNIHKIYKSESVEDSDTDKIPIIYEIILGDLSVCYDNKSIRDKDYKKLIDLLTKEQNKLKGEKNE